MMKKRIFISMHYMELGGAEMSLVGLLQAIDYSKYNVDLFIHSHQGELMQYIPAEVNLLPEMVEYSMVEKPLIEVLKAKLLRLFVARLKAKWEFKSYLKKKGITNSAAIFQYVGDNVTPILPSLNFLGEYDLAISFLNPHNVVLDKVLAKKKICWIHTDYTRIDINKEQEFPVWSGYDYIVSISLEVKNTFLQVFPQLKSKIIYIENILSSEFVRRRAEEYDASKEMPKQNGVINLLSVGRFTEAKNYDNVPDICKRILEKGVDVRWYIIGYGGDEDLIRQRIVENKMEKFVIIVGKRDNPYPYMKACDIYVQPSRYEGKSITVREAQLLYKPVVISNYPTAKSQVKNGIDGVIVPIDNARCANGIADFIVHKQLQSEIIKYLRTHDSGSIEEIEKLYLLME